MRLRSRPLDPAAAEAAEAAMLALREAIEALRTTLGEPGADAGLRLHRLEQRTARLEDLVVAAIDAPGADPAGPAHGKLTADPPAPEGAEDLGEDAPTSRSIELALEEDDRRAAKAVTAARKLSGPAALTGPDRFLARAERSFVGLLGDLQGHEDVPAVVLHVVDGGAKAQLSPVALFDAIDRGLARRMLVRDVHRSWLHRGVPGLGESPEEVAAAVDHLLEEHSARPVFVVGAGSSAGFSAVLLGALLGADKVVALGPGTTLDRAELAALGDTRCDADLQVLLARKGLLPAYTDLREVLAGSPTAVELHYATGDPVEVAHAERLRDMETVTLHPVDVEGPAHASLAEASRLAHLLQTAMTNPATP